MTVIMAVKRAGEVWLGSDTRVTEGDFPVDMDLRQDSKLLLLKNAVIGAAGDLTMRNYMELFVTRGNNGEFPFQDKLDVIEFFLAFKKFLKKHAGLGGSDMNQVQGIHNTQWLIATRKQIFTLDQDGAILEHPEMCVIGSGTYTARAILEYIQRYQPSLPVPKMLARAHDLSIRHNLSCGGDQLQVNVTKELR